MEILEFAIKKEAAMESFYRDLYYQTMDKKFAHVFYKMAEYEQNHLREIKKLGNPDYDSQEFIKFSDDTDFYSIFKVYKDDFKNLISYADTYQKLLKIERESENFYRQKALVETKAPNRNLLNYLADQEKKHAEFVEELLELVLESETKLENAEWNHPRDIHFNVYENNPKNDYWL